MAKRDSSVGGWLLVGGGAAIAALILGRKQVVKVAERAAGGLITTSGLRPFTYAEDTEIWNAARGAYESAPGDRSAQLYDAVIDQFHVSSNPRYEPRDGSTFCNTFASDVMLAMGRELPWGRANEIAAWLEGGGDSWIPVSMYGAQDAANAGQPVLAAWSNPSGPGHLAVVRPGSVSAHGPTIAQAGASNFDRGSAAEGFGSSRLPYVSFYTAA